ncbi:helix-turn-helix domain-containing protein [uncultured Brevundimonas sp.]|jgi:DNA-binding MarR family transcriptional regulator|uniref:helix-turn-helix domain-containing protein n=1 Tax=uncultured Brevundimonas sp. TaxID=213418 RepID=UPI00261B58D1|nr:helix-turn-helix domain-containing protein [uncultured Brevundimonas sp.]
MKTEIERLHRQLQEDLQESLESNLRLLLGEVKRRIRRVERNTRLAKHDPVGQDWRKAHDENGVPMREIARQIGVHPSTVMRRIRTARKAKERQN